MKIIFARKEETVLASTENASYPATNVLDNHPKKYWLATSSSATLRIVASTNAGAMAIHNTNATSLTVKVYNAFDLDVETTDGFSGGTEVDFTNSETALTETYELDANGIGQGWADFPAARSYYHIVDISLTNSSGSNIYAGVVSVGQLREYADPNYGLREGLKDYSIVEELNSGDSYVRKRDIARTFEITLLEDKADFYTLLHDIYRIWGPRPLSYRIVDGETDWEWVVFARYSTPPEGGHDYPLHKQMRINLLEVV